MVEINLDRAEHYREKMKATAAGMSYSMQELQNIIKISKRQEGLEDFLPFLSSALEELQAETQILKQMDAGLEEIITLWRGTDSRIAREYQQENVSQLRVDWASVSFSTQMLKDMGIRFRF